MFAALLGITACTSSASESAIATETPDASDVERQAGAFAKKMRVCVQNRTGEDLSFEWHRFMIDDTGNRLANDQRDIGLGSDATECAISFEDSSREAAGYETALMTVGGQSLKIHNPSSSKGLQMMVGDTTVWFKPGDIGSQTLPGSGNSPLVAEAVYDRNLVTFGSVEAYPVDITIYAAR